MALSPNVNALARFRIGESGQLIPVDGTAAGVFNPDVARIRAGACTITLVSDTVGPSLGGAVAAWPLNLNDYLALARNIAIPQPVPGQPFSSLSAAYVVSVTQLQGQAAGSVTPASYVEIGQPAPSKGANY